MQSPRVVNGHASSLSGYRDSFIDMEIRVGRVHRPTKKTLGAIVIQNRAFVMPLLLNEVNSATNKTNIISDDVCFPMS